ncbi:MAG: bifunctional nuclease family protein [Acidimicrobiales bacterium]|nr:bifunctional nuclease family protein [Acidimicrobiales bacterium]
MAVEMELVGVKVRMPATTPVLILREIEGGRRSVPIFIGGPEAHAIDLAVSETATARPMTHDLFVEVVSGLGAHFERVVVTKLVDGTFYADLVTVTSDGEERVFSARPSDAVALAVRAKIPIYAEPALIDEVGFVDEEDAEAADEDDIVEELRKFLDEVNPEDFQP